MQKQAIRTFIIILFACILLLCSSASVIAATIDDVTDNSLLIGMDVYQLSDTDNYILEKILDSITTGGNKVFYKINGLWFDLLSGDITSPADFTNPDKAIPHDEVESWELRNWYKEGETVVRFGDKDKIVKDAVAAIAALRSPDLMTLQTLPQDEPAVQNARELVDYALELGASEEEITNLWILEWAEAKISSFYPPARSADSVTQDPGYTGGKLLDYSFEPGTNKLTITGGPVTYYRKPGTIPPTGTNWVGLAIQWPEGVSFNSGDVINLTINGTSYTSPVSADEAVRKEMWVYLDASVDAYTLVIDWLPQQVLPENISVELNVTLEPVKYSDYSMSIDGPSSLLINQPYVYNVRAWGDGTGNSSYLAIYEYEVTGGEGTLEYKDGEVWRPLPLAGQFGPAGGFELTPDWDVTTELRFTPASVADYSVSVTLKTMDGDVLATASYAVSVPATYSDYEMSITGPTSLELGEPYIYNVRAWGDGTGNSSYLALYEYEVTGGEGTLEYKDGEVWRPLPLAGQFGPAGGFELTPDWDVTTELRFTPASVADYSVSITLRTMDGTVLATASYAVSVPATYSEYSMSIAGETELLINEPYIYNVRAWGNGTGNSSYTAIYDYAVTGGAGTLEYKDGEVWRPLPLSGHFGPAGGFELTPDWDVTTELRFTPAEVADYSVSITLRTLDGTVLATATYNVKVRSTYAFSYNVPELILEGEDVVVPVSFATDEEGTLGYEKVRFEFAAQGPGDVTFKAVDSEGDLHTFTNSGFWGPAGGFPLPASYAATTDWTLNFSAMGDYTITFKLVDMATGNAIAEGTQAVSVDRYSSYGFDYELPVQTLEGEDVVVPVTFATDVPGSLGYEAVRFEFSASGAGDVIFKATDSNGIEHSFTNSGFWGPAGGFPLPASYAATTDWTLNFSAMGDYTITFKLVDMATGNAIAEGTQAVSVDRYSSYGFDYELPVQTLEGEDVVVPVTFATDVPGSLGYEAVRFEFSASGAGDVIFKATDSNGIEHSFTNSGFWGPAGGFPLPASYAATTDWTLNFSAMGDYTITFKLVDMATGNAIAEGTQAVSVDRYSSYGFDYELPVQTLEGEDVVVPVTFATDVPGSLGYEAVRFEFSASGAGDVIFKATDSNGIEHSFTNSGFWGPAGGFPLPASYAATTDWTLNFSAMGDYTITFKLVDMATGNAIAEGTQAVSVDRYSSYGFDYELPVQTLEGEDVVVPVTFATDVPGSLGYEAVRFEFSASGAGDVIFKATDSNGIEHSFTNSGFWGPAGGFPLPASYAATTDWTLNFSAMGDYTITFKLVDMATGNAIAEGTQAVSVDRYSSYGFDYELPAHILEGEDVVVPVTFATDDLGSLGYEAVRFYFEKTAGAGDVTFKATDSKGVLHTFTNEGAWGPEEGFPLPAGYDATTDWTLNFAAADEYTIVFSLKDLATDAVLASESVTVTAYSFEQLLNGASAEILEFTEAEKLTHLGDAHFGFTTNYSNAQAAHPALLSDAFVTSDKDAVIRSYYVSDDGSWVAPPVEMTLTAGVGQYLKGEGNRDPLNVEKAKSYYRVEIVSVGGVSVDELTEEVTITLSLDDDVLVRNCKHTLASAAITLTLEPHVYNIVLNANPSAGGILSGGGSYTHGSAVTVVAQPAEGYDFVNWTEDGIEVSTDASYTFTADSDRSLVANFALIEYRVEISVIPADGGTVDGGGFFKHGDSVTVSATANTGFEFVGWFEDDEEVSSDQSYSFTVERGRVLVAKFKQIDYWKVIPDGLGLSSSFYVSFVDLPQATHYELWIDGIKADREAISDPVVFPTIAEGDPAGYEVRLFSDAEAVTPFATASCLGDPGDRYGKLIVHDTWSIEPYLQGYDFRVFTTNPGITHVELYANGIIVGTRFSINDHTRSISLVFADPSLLEVKFFNSASAEEPVAEAWCNGDAGDTFGRLVY